MENLNFKLYFAVSKVFETLFISLNLIDIAMKSSEWPNLVVLDLLRKFNISKPNMSALTDFGDREGNTMEYFPLEASLGPK